MQPLDDPDVKQILREITDRFIQSGKGTPAHQAKVNLGKKRKMLDELMQRQVLWFFDGKFYPRFLALESEGAETREYAFRCTELVLRALRWLYTAEGPRDYSYNEILNAVVQRIDLAVKPEMVHLGVLMAADFSSYIGSLVSSDTGTPGSVRLMDGILDFESLEAAWQEERAKRALLAEPGHKPQPVADQGEVTDRDPLLGIYNRGRFDRDLEAFLHAAPEKQIRSVVMLDLDHFKKVNDSFGHEAGDRVLKQAVSVLRSVCEGKGYPYRYGGEEFAVLLQNFASEEARALAERVRAEIYALHFGGRPEKITVSLGVASYPETSPDLAKLVSDADTALYAAKNAGRNRVCVAAPNAGELSKPSDGIEDGIDLEELSVSITQGIAENFMILVKNESDLDVTIRKIVLKSKDIRLTDPVLPPSRDAWKIPAHGRLPIEFKATSDPTWKLAAIYDRMVWTPPLNMIDKAEIEFSFQCEVQGQLLKMTSKKLVYVDGNRRIWEL